MPRPKLPKDKVKETVGIKLTPDVITELEAIGKEWDCKLGTAGRELLLLGLAVYRAAQASEVFGKSPPDIEIAEADDVTVSTARLIRRSRDD